MAKVVYASNGAVIGDGMRITRVSQGGQKLEVLVDAKTERFSEIELRGDAPQPEPDPEPTPDPEPEPVPDPEPEPTPDPGPLPAPSVHVSGQAALNSAIAAAGPGDVIAVGAGTYDLSLRRQIGQGVVTIIPEPGAAPEFRTLSASGAEGWMLNGLTFRQAANASKGAKNFEMSGSRRMTLRNTRSFGSKPDGYGKGVGFYAYNCENIAVIGGDFRDFADVLVFITVTGARVEANHIRGFSVDGIKLHQVADFDIIDNIVTDRLAPAEQERLLKALRADLHPMVKFALMTGARIETIAGLRWADVDLDGGRLLFRVKGGGRQVFPMNAELRAFLSALPRAEALPHREFVITFVDGQTGERKRIRASGGSLFDDFRKALAAAGIADFRFHDLRHTFATRLLRLTGNLKLVSRLLGHRSIETTMRYAHVLDKDLVTALDGFRALSSPRAARTGRKTSRRSWPV